jgi:hypothetical protein
MNADSSPKSTDPESLWERTKFQHLIRYAPSGRYFAKFKAGGRQYRFGLEPTAISVPNFELAGVEKRRCGKSSKRRCEPQNIWRRELPES